MNPELLRAEFDSVQVTIIVLAVIFSFIKWLWEQWRGKKEEPETVTVDEIERQLREEAWRRQTGQQRPAAPAPERPSPPTAAPRPIAEPLPGPPPQGASPWEEIRRAWRELREAAQQEQQPLPAPAQPTAQKRQRRQDRIQQAAPPHAEPPKPLAIVEMPQPAAQPAVRAPSAAATPMLQSLRQLRDDPAAMRRAIVLSEVLSPPKALHS